MPSRILPNLGLDAFFLPGESGWDDEVSRNFLLLSVLTQGGVLEMVSATPGSPANGDVYLFSDTHPTEPNKIAIRDDDAWLFVTPLEGWRVYDRDADALKIFTGTVWETFTAALPPLPYSVPFGFTTSPEDGEVMLITVFAEGVTFPDNFADSQAYVGTNPTDTTVFTIRKNGTEVGTISVSSAGASTFDTTSGAVSFAPGDVLQIDAQATADATIANCAFTLLAERD